MTTEEFFDLFLLELDKNPNLRNYYKFLNNRKKSVFNFRRNYYLQRLNYINENLKFQPSSIWDCGCGFGTTAIFLALNGHAVFGNTLEYYFEQIPERLNYWKKFGDLSKLELSYQNVFDIHSEKKYDYIIAQDTLHHLEPLDNALTIICGSLKSTGKLIVIEVNGSNIIERSRYFIQRGNKRIIEIYDEKLQKTYKLGNENVRPLKKWNKILQDNSLCIEEKSIIYIRLFFPVIHRIISSDLLGRLESGLWKRSALLRNYFYFGLNFIAIKKDNEDCR
jgi:2-polyprenyl-3-methyl-5-hydroxy-6-metoxy-1,4-benzoquinol methylase